MEEESIAGWINRNEQVIKMKMPTNFDELETYNEGHILVMYSYSGCGCHQCRNKSTSSQCSSLF